MSIKHSNTKYAICIGTLVHVSCLLYNGVWRLCYEKPNNFHTTFFMRNDFTLFHLKMEGNKLLMPDRGSTWLLEMWNIVSQWNFFRHGQTLANKINIKKWIQMLHFELEWSWIFAPEMKSKCGEMIPMLKHPHFFQHVFEHTDILFTKVKLIFSVL